LCAGETGGRKYQRHYYCSDGPDSFHRPIINVIALGVYL